MAYAIIIVGILAVIGANNPKHLTNHIPHTILPKNTADKVQKWLESL